MRTKKMPLRRICLLAVSCPLLVMAACATHHPVEVARVTAPPTFAGAFVGKTFNVVDYGAVGDGTTDNTDAIRKTFDAAVAAGGGRVLVPSGTYLTRGIELRSSTDFHLAEGATILFSHRFSDYPLIAANWEGKDTYVHQSPLWADNAHDIAVTGPGIIDGQGDGWRTVEQTSVPKDYWDQLMHAGGYVALNKKRKAVTWYPSKAAHDGEDALTALRSSTRPTKATLQDFIPYADLLRPSLVLLSNCKNILLDGPTFQNSPNWNLHLLLSDNIIVRNVTIMNPSFAHNGDGIDIDSCRNVTMTDSTVHAGDDGICMKSGADAEGRARNRPTENVTISNCIVYWAHGGVVIGSEMSGGVRNVAVSNCVFIGTNAGLRFKSQRGRGGTVENIKIDNISMSDIQGAAIIFDMYYMSENSKVEPLSERTPRFQGFSVKNVSCDGAKEGILIRGLPELAIADISLDKVRITADKGITLTDAKDISLKDVSLKSTTRPAMDVTNVSNLTMENVEVEGAPPPATKPSTTNPSTAKPWSGKHGKKKMKSAEESEEATTQPAVEIPVTQPSGEDSNTLQVFHISTTQPGFRSPASTQPTDDTANADSTKQN